MTGKRRERSLLRTRIRVLGIVAYLVEDRLWNRATAFLRCKCNGICMVQ